jgi:hypothetical protein
MCNSSSMTLVKYINLNRYNIPNIISKFSYTNYTEIGIQNGNFTKFILNSCNISPVIGVDPFLPCFGKQCGWSHSQNDIVADQKMQLKTKLNCLKNLSQFGNRFKFFNMTSIEYGLTLQDQSLDIIFIDGDHSEEGVYQDLTIFYKKIKKGGMIVGHDYGGNFGKSEAVVQVKPAVDKFCLNNSINYFVTNIDYRYREEVQSFFIYKK